MNKIPTVFNRNPETRRFVIDQINPECEWVINNEGIPRRKYDGTCVMLDGDRKWWARREVKKDKTPPENFRQLQFDEVTGKAVGYIPIEDSSFYKFFLEANRISNQWNLGTYELVGPKINGNPENLDRHEVVFHDGIRAFPVGHIPSDTAYVYLRRIMNACKNFGWEGLVWTHPDGRRAKLKVRDFEWSE